jgi:hypothetical protein
MKIVIHNLIFPGLNEGDRVDFSKVKTVEQLKETIINNYVVLCRNCASESFCKFYDSSEPPCPILEKVVHNYIDMNIKSIDTGNQHSLSRFIESVILLTKIFSRFENWRGSYVDEGFNWYFEGFHPTLNSIYALNLLVEISEFVRAYEVVKTDRVKKFIVFVEGNSEFAALPPIFEALWVLGIKYDIKNSVKFINLEGKDRVQRDKIKTILVKLSEEEVSYFLILDNDQNVKHYIEDLKREGLIEESHYLIWESKFEDNFGEEAILKVFREEASELFDKIDIDELKQYNSTKNDIGMSIEHLLREKGIKLRFNDYKLKIAKRISEWICKEINESMQISSGTHNGGRTPTSKSFPDFVRKIRMITEEIKRISSEFHVIKR